MHDITDTYRLAIQVDVTIVHLEMRSSASPIPTFALVDPENGVEVAYMEQMHAALEHMLVWVYQRVKCLWRDRDDAWIGKLVITERTTWTCALTYMMAFQLKQCVKSGAEGAGTGLR